MIKKEQKIIKRILFGVVRIAIIILYICVITGKKDGGEIHYEGRH